MCDVPANILSQLNFDKLDSTCQPTKFIQINFFKPSRFFWRNWFWLKCFFLPKVIFRGENCLAKVSKDHFRSPRERIFLIKTNLNFNFFSIRKASLLPSAFSIDVSPILMSMQLQAEVTIYCDIERHRLQESLEN